MKFIIKDTAKDSCSFRYVSDIISPTNGQFHFKWTDDYRDAFQIDSKELAAWYIYRRNKHMSIDVITAEKLRIFKISYSQIMDKPTIEV